jgi:hypothetical protein
VRSARQPRLTILAGQPCRARVLAASLCASSAGVHQAMEAVVSFLKVRHKQVDGINSEHTASTLGVSVRTPGALNSCRESRLNSRDRPDENGETRETLKLHYAFSVNHFRLR